MRGGDKIKVNSLYMSILVLCLAVGGLISFGALNDQKTDNLDNSKILNPAYAEDTDNVSSKKEVDTKSEDKKSNIITVRGKCSCSLLTDYSVHKKSWLNYCPRCHSYGTLSFTRGGGCPEGMLYCNMAKGGCDADFCAVHGKEHVYSGATYLRHA